MNSDFYSSSYSFDDKRYIESIYSDGYHGLGQTARKSGDFKKAADYMALALKYNNDFTDKSELLTILGDIYYEEGNSDKAISTYEKAVREDEKNLKARLKLAWANYFAKRYGNAENVFENAFSLNRNNAESVYGLAISQYMNGKPDKARIHLANAIMISPYYADNQFVHEIIGKNPEWRSLWKDFGLAYYRLGYYASALYKLDGYLQKVNAEDDDALIAAAWSSRWLGYLDKAKAGFELAAKKNPKADEPLVGLGSTYLAYGKAPESLSALNQALTVNPDSAIAYNVLAYLNLYRKDEKKAEESLKKSLSLNKSLFDAQAFLANLYFKQKRYDEAAKEYEKLIQINKRVATSWNNLGWTYFYMSQYDKAIPAFNESKQINPYLAEPYYALGLIYAKKGELDLAKAQMKTAIEIYPSYAHTSDLLHLIKANPGWNDLYGVLGWSYYYKQQYQKALDVFNEYLAVKPDDGAIMRGVAWSSYWINLDDAYAAFQHLLKKDENDVDALVGSGWTLFYKGKDREALAYLERAIRKDPKLTNAWRTIAAIHFRNKEFKEAEKIYKKVAELEPRATDARNNQGWVLYKERKYGEAIEKFNDSLRLNRYFGEPHYGLALCYTKIGEIDQAKTSFTTAIQLYPGYMDGRALYNIIESNRAFNDLYNVLGWSYYYKYYYEAAKFHFNRMLKLDPKNRDAVRGLDTIAKVLGTAK
jgi:tetratricopeptide (TPR) repeat protein